MTAAFWIICIQSALPSDKENSSPPDTHIQRLTTNAYPQLNATRNGEIITAAIS